MWLVTWDIQAFSDFFMPRMIYMAALTTGIWISMLRQQRRRSQLADTSFAGKLRRIGGVWLFYCLLHIWNIGVPGSGDSIADRFAFMCSLFGL